jgi:serine/threonine-protein kinase
MTAEPAPVTQVRPTVSAEVVGTMSRLLAKAPADRYGTGAQLVAALAPPTIPAAREGTPRITVRRIVMYGAVAVSVVLVGSWLLSAVLDGDAAGAEVPKLAVLPLENLGSPDDEYFADGMTGEITSRLAKISGLQVTSRQSAIQYKSSTKSLREIGQELGVDYVLEGTVRTDRSSEGAGQVRITPQLIKVSDDAHLWTDAYTAQLAPGEIFGVQAQVAERVAQALDVTLLAAERLDVDRQATDNMQAYDYYMRGAAHSMRTWFDAVAADQAVEMFTRAVELDSTFALAYAGLVEAVSVRYRFHGGGELARAEVALARALALAPNLPEVQLAAGVYDYHGRRDYDGALERLNAVRRRQPNNARAIFYIGVIHWRQGKWEQGADDFEHAAALDPLNHRILGSLYVLTAYLRRYAEAEPYLDRAISLAPDVFDAMRPLFYLKWDGSTERAVRSLREYTARGGSVSAFTGQWSAFTGQDGILIRSLPNELAPLLADYTVDTWPGARPHDYYQAKAWVHLGLGQPAVARAYWDSSSVYQEARFAADSTYPVDLRFAYAGSGRHAEALRITQEMLATLPVPTTPPISPDTVDRVVLLQRAAPIYVMVGEYDEAIAYLEELVSTPSNYSVGLLRVDPLWDPLRDNPRFQALLEKYAN